MFEFTNSNKLATPVIATPKSKAQGEINSLQNCLSGVESEIRAVHRLLDADVIEYFSARSMINKILAKQGIAVCWTKE